MATNTSIVFLNIFTLVAPGKDLKQVSNVRRGSLNALQLHSTVFSPLSSAVVVRYNPKSGAEQILCATYHIVLNIYLLIWKVCNLVFCDFKVLRKNVTCEELQTPGAPFIRKVLTVSNWLCAVALHYFSTSTIISCLINYEIKTLLVSLCQQVFVKGLKTVNQESSRTPGPS